MKINEKETNKIIELLKKSMSSEGLKVEKEELPTNQHYKQEWVIRDRENWNYGYFGTSEEQYLYATIHNDSFPFDATEKLLWIKAEIPRIVNSLFSDKKNSTII